jgi:CheY-like chemotaxis protein
MMPKKPVIVLVADDDSEDRMMIQEAFKESHVTHQILFVENGEVLLDYLNQVGQYSNAEKYPRPGLILLDLNMPKKDGREALKEIKESSHLKGIPVVVLTTSKADEDVLRTYNLGVNSFISKPVTFNELVTITRDLGRYWFEIVELPKPIPYRSR